MFYDLIVCCIIFKLYLYCNFDVEFICVLLEKFICVIYIFKWFIFYIDEGNIEFLWF